VLVFHLPIPMILTATDIVLECECESDGILFIPNYSDDFVNAKATVHLRLPLSKRKIHEEVTR
jgi:hypothetical protein